VKTRAPAREQEDRERGEHDQPRLAGVGADVFERANAVGAERLEECELGLDADHVWRDRVDDPAAESPARLGRCGP